MIFLSSSSCRGWGCGQRVGSMYTWSCSIVCRDVCTWKRGVGGRSRERKRNGEVVTFSAGEEGILSHTPRWSHDWLPWYSSVSINLKTFCQYNTSYQLPKHCHWRNYCTSDAGGSFLVVIFMAPWNILWTTLDPGRLPPPRAP